MAPELAVFRACNSDISGRVQCCTIWKLWRDATQPVVMRGAGHARARRQPWPRGSADRTFRPSSCDERRSPISRGVLDPGSGIGYADLRRRSRRCSDFAHLLSG